MPEFDAMEVVPDTRYLSPDEIDMSAGKATRRYPLPAKEANMLTALLVASDIIFIIIGLFLANIVPGGDSALQAALSSASVAAAPGASALSPESLASPASWGWAASTFALLALIGIATEGWACAKWPQYAQDMLANRQEHNGELLRLPIWQLVLLVAFVGAGEELLFRYGISAFLLELAGIGSPLVYLATSLIVAAVFALAHANYKSIFAKVQVFVIAIILSAVFLMHGSIWVCAIAHAAYDLTALLMGRRQIMKMEDPFGGKVPARLLSGEKATSKTLA